MAVGCLGLCVEKGIDGAGEGLLEVTRNPTQPQAMLSGADDDEGW